MAAHRDASASAPGYRRPAEPATLTLVAVLAVATGSLDAMSFLRLGHVFTSVMTGNLVQLGVAAGTRDPRLAVLVAVAVGSFAVGVAAGSAIAGPAQRGTGGWPSRVTAALAVELLPLGGFSAWWVLSGGHPVQAMHPGLVALAASAMGLQSAAVRAVAIGGMSSTYLTGTLTGAVAQLVRRGPISGRGFAAIAGLLAGAVGGGVLAVRAAPTAPAIPLAVVTTVVLAALVRRPGRTGAAEGSSGSPG